MIDKHVLKFLKRKERKLLEQGHEDEVLPKALARLKDHRDWNSWGLPVWFLCGVFGPVARLVDPIGASPEPRWLDILLLIAFMIIAGFMIHESHRRRAVIQVLQDMGVEEADRGA